MPRSYIEAIDRPTVLYVLYSMVIVRPGCAFFSNQEQGLKFRLRGNAICIQQVPVLCHWLGKTVPFGQTASG